MKKLFIVTALAVGLGASGLASPVLATEKHLQLQEFDYLGLPMERLDTAVKDREQPQISVVENQTGYDGLPVTKRMDTHRKPVEPEISYLY